MVATKLGKKVQVFKKFNRLLKPYWNQELGDFHKRMTLKRTAWVAAGKPRESDCYHILNINLQKENSGAVTESAATNICRIK